MYIVCVVCSLSVQSVVWRLLELLLLALLFYVYIRNATSEDQKI